ncbi:MAG TPA: DUF624 domain-containing protein [Actinocatenispora sp.]
MRHWRETVRGGSELALLGFAMTLAALPVVTAGAAVGTASAAVHHWCQHNELPPYRTLGRWFVRALVPGLGATGIAVAATVVLAVDLWAAAGNRIPGAPVVLALTAVLAALATGAAALVVVRVGATEGRHWRAALRRAGTPGHRSLPTVPALAGVVALAALLGSLLPAAVPLIAVTALFAAHVATRRLAG